MSCSCPVNDDGDCVRCRGKIYRVFFEAAESHRKYLEEIDGMMGQVRDVCQDCGLRYMDGSIAHLLDSVLEKSPDRDLALKMMQWAMATLHGIGISAIPQTLKAWKDLCRRKGWDEDLV